MRYLILFLLFSCSAGAANAQARIWAMGATQATTSGDFLPGIGGALGLSYEWISGIAGVKGLYSETLAMEYGKGYTSRLMGFSLFYGFKKHIRDKSEWFIGPSLGFLAMGVIREGYNSSKPTLGAIVNFTRKELIGKLNLEFSLEPKLSPSLGYVTDINAPFDGPMAMLDFQVGLSYRVR